MSDTRYIAPRLRLRAFNCPHCNAFAQQDWTRLSATEGGKIFPAEELCVSTCSLCYKYVVWNKKEMIYPIVGPFPPAPDDMPGRVKAEYDEARQIAVVSPRSAAALLRQAIFELCKHLGAKGDDPGEVAASVKNDLPIGIHRALDVARVVGKDAVRPGVVDSKDDRDAVENLFDLVNIIVEQTITNPNRLSAFCQKVAPDDPKKSAKTRDKK